MNLETEHNIKIWFWFLFRRANFTPMNRVLFWNDNFSLIVNHASEYEISIRNCTRICRASKKRKHGQDCESKVLIWKWDWNKKWNTEVKTKLKKKLEKEIESEIKMELWNLGVKVTWKYNSDFDSENWNSNSNINMNMELICDWKKQPKI